jgi:hypothetical protein
MTPKLYLRNASDSDSILINDSDSTSIDVIYWPRTMTINRNSTTTRPKQRRLSVLATTIEVKSSEGLHGKTSYVALSVPSHAKLPSISANSMNYSGIILSTGNISVPPTDHSSSKAALIPYSSAPLVTSEKLENMDKAHSLPLR